jgi:hypothetical protein
MQSNTKILLSVGTLATLFARFAETESLRMTEVFSARVPIAPIVWNDGGSADKFPK